MLVLLDKNWTLLVFLSTLMSIQMCFQGSVANAAIVTALVSIYRTLFFISRGIVCILLKYMTLSWFCSVFVPAVSARAFRHFVQHEFGALRRLPVRYLAAIRLDSERGRHCWCRFRASFNRFCGNFIGIHLHALVQPFCADEKTKSGRGQRSNYSREKTQR